MPSKSSTPPDAPFWFASNANVDRAERGAQPELPLSPDRFPYMIESYSDDQIGDTAYGEAVRKLVAQANDVPPSDVDDGLVRLLEALNADTNYNKARLSAGPEYRSTEAGTLLVITQRAHVPLTMDDPDNGRNSDDLALARVPTVLDEHDHDVLALPVQRVHDAEHLKQLIDINVESLGFEAAVNDTKDRLDLEKVGSQGVHKPLLIAPTMFVDDVGNSSWGAVKRDGNRRGSAAARVIRQATGKDPRLAMAHMDNGDGLVLRDLTEADIRRTRQLLRFGDHGDGRLFPKKGSDKAIEVWLNGPVKADRAIAAFVRARTVEVEIVVGVHRPLRDGLRNPSIDLIDQEVRRRHIPEAADKPWDASAARTMIVKDQLKAIREVLEDHDEPDAAPLSVSDVDRLLANSHDLHWNEPGLRHLAVGDEPVVPVRFGPEGAENIGEHVDLEDQVPGIDTNLVRLSTKFMITMVGRGHKASKPINQVLRDYSVAALPKQRAQAASHFASLVVNATLGTSANRITAALGRTFDHSMFWELDDHEGTDDGHPWWWLLDTDVLELYAMAVQEHRNPDERETPRKPDCGRHGPATRALAALGALALIVNPASRDQDGQLTMNGMGGVRGDTAVDASAIISAMLRHEEGLAQLAEAVVATMHESGSQPPRNVVFDPSVEPDASQEPGGRPDPTTIPLLKETVLRGSTYGWGVQGSGEEGADHERTAAERYDDMLRQIGDAVRTAAVSAVAIGVQPDRESTDADDEDQVDFFEVFLMQGIEENIATGILEDLNTITTTVNRGALIWTMRREQS